MPRIQQFFLTKGQYYSLIKNDKRNKNIRKSCVKWSQKGELNSNVTNLSSQGWTSK